MRDIYSDCRPGPTHLLQLAVIHLQHVLSHRALLLPLFVVMVACEPAATDDAAFLGRLPETVDYNYHIKPILSDRCYKCHGPDANKREAGLRLDTKEGAIDTPLESGNHAIKPGNIRSSELVKRIRSSDPEFMMPPPESNLSLSAFEKALLSRWISQGAEWKPHWSFIPPQLSGVPEVKEIEWARNPVDVFVLARLEREALSPAGEAPRAQWLRRVTFDLTGLPPTLEALEAFIADTSAGAYEAVVDGLLASVHYGERMAVDWLDVARYADSHGYQDDGYRFVWPWRDWVVRAYNDNMPYDEFLTLQLAGDLLPNATQEQKLATTFLRNHRINSEAGIVGEEYRVEYVADRTHTVGTAMMGLTLECARCHDHKYDPISQKEYYKLFSFFNNVRELGEIANEGNPGPLMLLTNDAVDRTLDSLHTQIANQEHELSAMRDTFEPTGDISVSAAELTAGLDQEQSVHLTFEALDKGVANHARPSEPAQWRGTPELVEGPSGLAISMESYDVVQLPDFTSIERTDPFSISLWMNPTQDSAYVPIWGNPAGKNTDFRGFELFLLNGVPHVRLCHAIPHNYIEVHAQQALPLNAWTHVSVTYDGSSRARGLTLYIDGRAEPLTVAWDNLYKTVKQRGLRIGGNNSRGGFDGGRVDEFRFHHRVLAPLEVSFLASAESRRGRATATGTHVGPASQQLLAEYLLLTQHQPAKTLRDALRELREAEHRTLDTLREIMVMEEMAIRRPAFMLRRGLYDAPEEEVAPGTPAALPAFPAGAPRNRLGLARWLTDPAHPLTARVAVNRLWQLLFGQGLVSTPGDWGSQGALPSHPELLDWLAVRFVESGWDKKALVKTIVLSSTYRQSSLASKEAMRADPANLLLARGPRFRLPAEMLRDQALAVSGLLVPKMGGPPVKPYQPPGLWEEIAAIKNSISTYEQDHGEKLYRRSLYTFWKRSAPPPSLTSFDAPTRELCLVQRQNTSTPLQALVLWNDPQFVEAARMLAERLMQSSSSSSEDQIALGFNMLTSRPPNPFELQRLKDLFEQQRNAFHAEPERAAALLRIGEHPRDTALDAAHHAALTVIAQTLMNLDEVVMRL